jgi:uncharacterized protein (DUF488 family)
MARTIYTIGHSTRTLADFEQLLEDFGVTLLVDIRTVPRSRHVPHFNSGKLARALARKKIEYCHLKDLGGLRKPSKESINLGWRNLSFRGYADYMQSEEFRAGLAELQRLAAKKKSAIMCAEAVPWRCHRSLVADALTARGWQVRHILSTASQQIHQLTPFAVIDGESVTYPQR